MTEYFCEYSFSDAGAYRDVKISYRTVRRASDIRINDHIVINGKPCRVFKISTVRDFCHFHTINILNGNLVRNIFHSSKDIDIPDVSRDLYQLMNISSKDNSVSLLHYTGDYTRDDIKLPENEFLRTMMVGGIDHGKRVLVAVVSSLGKDAIYGVEVDQTGSAIRIKPNEDAVNQRITKDSDVVVNQSKTKDSDVAKKACLKEEATNSDVAEKACLKEEATAKYGYEYTQRSYRDAVLGHNATGEDIY